MQALLTTLKSSGGQFSKPSLLRLLGLCCLSANLACSGLLAANDTSSNKNLNRSALAKSRAKAGILAMVDNTPIKVSDLSADYQTEEQDLLNEYELRKLQLRWSEVENLIDELLLKAEAEKRHMPVSDLLAAEVTSKIKKPTLEQLKSYYETKKPLLNVSFEVAKPYLETHLIEEQQSELHRDLLEKLRASTDISYSLEAPDDLPRYNLPLTGAPSKGNAQAPVTIVLFSNFQCPYCAESKRLVDYLQTLYPEKIKVVFKDLPLPQHVRSKPAAYAAFCAGEQDKFWAYHDLLFEHTSNLENGDLQRYAQELGLNLTKFNSCLSSPRPKQAIEESLALAKRYHVRGTPTIFINGLKLMGLVSLPILQTFVDKELK